MGFGSADLTYFFPKYSYFKLINIIALLGEGEGQGWGTKSWRVQSPNDHSGYEGSRKAEVTTMPGLSARWVLSRQQTKVTASLSQAR